MYKIGKISNCLCCCEWIRWLAKLNLRGDVYDFGNARKDTMYKGKEERIFLLNYSKLQSL